jgi:pentatricopeptide repeat protein
LEDARAVFDEIPHNQKNIVTWTVMMAVLGSHGCGQQSLELFKQLEETELCPNEITFTALLNALSHTGMVDEGFQYFDSMQTQYSLIPTIEHQNCMVDLLGRSGQLERAEQFIINQVPNPNLITWKTLLGACRTHGDVERAERVAQHALQLDPSDSSIYVLLFNIYAAAGRHDDAKRVRDLMRTEGVKKTPGISSISVKGKLHIFKANESDHESVSRIKEEMKLLLQKIKELEYKPDTTWVTRDVPEEMKEELLCQHSEKFAVVFGLMELPPNEPVRVIKNLRICGDCHTASKFISKVYPQREIIIRDANRFHHFKNGKCSCNDYY